METKPLLRIARDITTNMGIALTRLEMVVKAINLTYKTDEEQTVIQLRYETLSAINNALAEIERSLDSSEAHANIHAIEISRIVIGNNKDPFAMFVRELVHPELEELRSELEDMRSDMITDYEVDSKIDGLVNEDDLHDAIRSVLMDARVVIR